ncbi:unnamed protein product [Lymnaea stagnalis]|uniref:Proton-coupled folate transporter n=1 Tax=Lymnaea stagnalis TaxID=6523 RepID=A0AAV2H6R6_LYMST
METSKERQRLTSSVDKPSYQTVAEFQPSRTRRKDSSEHSFFSTGLLVPTLTKGKYGLAPEQLLVGRQLSPEPGLGSRSRRGSAGSGRRRSLVSSKRCSSVSNGLNIRSSVLAADSGIEHWPLVLLTLITVFVSSAARVYSLVLDQYLYSVYAKTLFGDRDIDTSSKPCLNTSDNSPNSTADKAMVTEVQNMTSNMHLYLDLISYGVGMLSNMALGASASLISRKLLLTVPIVGYFLKMAMLSIVVYWELDVSWFYLSYGVDGLCGNTSGIFLGAFLYTTDITSRDKKRTLGVAIVEAVKGIASGAVYVVAGQLIERSGFMVPSLVATGLQFVAICLVLFLPNRKRKDLEKRKQFWSLKGAVNEMLSPFVVPEDKTLRTMTGIAALSFLVLILARSGVDKIRNLFLMNLPFCFDAITIGWFLFAREVAQYAFTMIAVAFMYRWLPGFGLAILGVVSNIAGFLMYAFSQTEWNIYLAPVLGVAENLSFTLIRGEGSRLLAPELQGPWFASLAVLDSISLALSPPIFIPVYTASLGVFPGAAFVGCSAVLVIVIVLMVIYQVLWVRYMKEFLYKTLEIVSEEEENITDVKRGLTESTKLLP